MMLILLDLLDLLCLILACEAAMLVLGWLASWPEQRRELDWAASERPE